MAFNAFGLNSNTDPNHPDAPGYPVYKVEVRVEDSHGGVSAPAFFDWRVAQELVEEIPVGSGGGDGDGDGDGGLEGVASDGAGLPLAGAMRRLLDLDGIAVQNQGVAISDEADIDGGFLLSIPQIDPANMTPGAPLQDVEGFIECNPPGRPDLAVSSYVNAKGMQRNERLLNLVVDPTTTLMRKVAESFETQAPNAERDMVGIQARFLDDISSLQTGSPSAVTSMVEDDAICATVPGAVTEVTDAIDIPLLAWPQTHDQRNPGMAAYAASQLYLAALKGETVGMSTPIQASFCLDVDVVDIQNPPLMDFSTALNAYYVSGGLLLEDLFDILVNLGLTQNAGLVTSPKTEDCSCNPSYTGRPELLAQSMMANRASAETSFPDPVTLTEALGRSRFQIRVVDNQVPPQFIADQLVRIIDPATGDTVNRGTTDANGEVSIGFNLDGVGLFAPKEYRIRVDRAGFATKREDRTAVAVSAIDVLIQLEPEVAP